MQILENGQYHQDQWTYLKDATSVFPEGNIVVTKEQLKKALGRNSPGKLGVALNPDDDVEQIAPYLDRLDVICLTFPAFNDGRAFSQARELRETYGYEKNIRVMGHFLPDQYEFLHRCGVNQIRIASQEEKRKWEKVPQFFSRAYQPSTRQEENIGPLFRRKIEPQDPPK